MDCPGGRPSGGRTVSARDPTSGIRGPEVGPIGLGAMSFAGYYGAADDEEGAAHDPPRPRPRDHPDRHGRVVRRRPQRGARGAGDRRTPRRGGARHQVEPRLGRTTCARPARRSLARLGRGPHRPLLPPPRQRRGADRGVGRRDGAAGGGRARGPRRPLGGRRRRRCAAAHAVHPIAALQSEYSLLQREPEEEMLPTCRELGIASSPTAPSPAGCSPAASAAPTTWPTATGGARCPRFQGTALERTSR